MVHFPARHVTDDRRVSCFNFPKNHGSVFFTIPKQCWSFLDHSITALHQDFRDFVWQNKDALRKENSLRIVSSPHSITPKRWLMVVVPPNTSHWRLKSYPPSHEQPFGFMKIRAWHKRLKTWRRNVTHLEIHERNGGFNGNSSPINSVSSSMPSVITRGYHNFQLINIPSLSPIHP